MGRRCTHSYASRLLPFDGGLIYVDEGGQKHVFKREGGGFTLPEGLEADLSISSKGYELSMSDGTSLLFDEEGKLSQKRDSYGNGILFRYSEEGLLSEIEDAFGRRIRVERRSDGLISALRDFADRRFVYEYNGQGEMIGATSPATPDFPSGKTTAYRYDRAHRMSMIVDPLGRPFLRNRYDEEGRVVGQRYGEGGWMSVAYGEGSGDVASRAWVTGADGSTRLYEHDVEGRLMRKWLYRVGGYKLISQYTYDGEGRMVFECGGSGRCRGFVYSGEGAGSKLERIVRRPSGGGKPRSFEVPGEPPTTLRNSFGQVVQESRGEELVRYEYYSSADPDGDGVGVPGARAQAADGGYLKRIVRGELFVEFKYDPLGNITSVSDGTGVRARFSVNALNQVASEEKPGESAFTYRYDACDNLVQVSEKNGASRELRYDRLGRLMLDRLEFAPGRFAETAYSRNDDGTIAELSLPEGNRVLFEYDGEARPVCVVRGAGSPDESRECVERSPEGEAVAFVDGEGFRTILERDGLGDLSAVVDPMGNRSEFERDDAGRVTGRRDYDARGRLLAAARFSYSADGAPEGAWRLLWRDDPARARWVELRGEEGSPAGAGGKAQEHGAKARSEAPSLSWNRNGLLSSITDGAGRTTRFLYDSRDRLVLERYPDGTERRTSYDGRGLVTRSVGRGGESLDMEYDAAGRLVLRRASPAQGAEGARLQRFEYDGLGRMTLAVDEGEASDPDDDAVSRFVYDSLSRPVAEEAGGAWISREFDDRGMVTMLSLPSGETFFFAYDGAGKLASVMSGGSRVASYEYDSAGRLSSERLGDMPSIHFERDGSGKLLSARGARGDRQIEGGLEVVYGEDGLVSRERVPFGFVRSYERDASGRLVEARDSCDAGDMACAAGRARRWSYEYDEGGEVKGRGTRAGLKLERGGRVSGVGGLSFEYDSLGRLSRATRGGERVASYSYDAFDRRVAKSDGEGRRRFLWNGFQLVREEGGGEPGASYAYGVAGSSPVAAISEGKTWYLMKDRLGSVSALVDSEGAAHARCSYGPYGEAVDECRESCGSIRFPFGFAGHIHDAETNLVYMRHRFYSPELAGFLTPDPLDYRLPHRPPPAWRLFPSTSYHSGQGGASRATFPNRPLAVSTYYGAWPFGRALRVEAPAAGIVETDLNAYARGDPSTFVDPLGLAHLLFDRSDEVLKLVMDGGGEWGVFAAANRTTRPGADPMRVGGNGPFPNGTYSIGLPEFYSEEYREEVRINYEMGIFAPWETALTGDLWRRNAQSEHNYHASYGRIRIRAGGPTDGAVWERGLFIHGGRHDFRKKTLGCIRVDDADLELLAIGMINLARDGDPVTSITVQD